MISKEIKNHYLKINNLKTTSKLCSAARAVRLSGSTRGLLPLHFFVIFDIFKLRADSKAQILILIRVVHADDEFVFEGVQELSSFRFSVSDFEKNTVELT